MEIKTHSPIPPPLHCTTTEKQSQKEREWIEVVPHGLVGGMVPNLCLMIFKEKSGTDRFAVSLAPLQAKIALNQSLHREEPFRFISVLLDTMGVRIEKCYFLKNDKGVITVQLMLKGHSAVQSLQLVASDVIPFAVYAGCEFYCTKKFISEMLDQKIEHPVKSPVKKPLYPN